MDHAGSDGAAGAAGAGTGAGAGDACATGAATTPRRVAVVTGGNQGIGFECCRLLASAGAHFDVILAARSEERGKAAVASLKAAGIDNVRWLAPLDISDGKSVEGFGEALEKDTGRLDILLNNAGVAFDPREADTEDRARVVLDTNFAGTVAVTEALMPLLRKSTDARVVTLCSQAGKQGRMSEAIRRRVTGTDATRDSLRLIANEYLSAVVEGSLDDAGFGNNAYGVSKLLLVAYTTLLAREKGSDDSFASAACCPGYCSTAMTHHTGTRTAAEGADTPAWLCTRSLTRDEARAANGCYYYERKPLPWP